VPTFKLHRDKDVEIKTSSRTLKWREGELKRRGEGVSRGGRHLHPFNFYKS